ncbi:MAG: TauD/TfdA family dioxygenase [Sphingomonadaceae bacterium]
MADIQISNLDDALSFGSRVAGVTDAALDDAAVRKELAQLFEDRGVIVFEGVEPSAAMQVKISEVFGPLKDHPVAYVQRADADKLLGVIEITAKPDGAIVEIDGEQLVTWQPWHFDHAYNNELNRAGVLRSLKIAGTGGRTAFADGIQIWNDMDAGIRAKAEGMELLLNLDLRYGRQRFGLPENFRVIQEHADSMSEENENGRCAVHPAVWTRATGEKVFHMTGYGCRGMVGDKSDAAFAAMDEVWREAMRVIEPYYHEWHPTDMVIWDNWRILHQACGCAPGQERVVHRTTIKGDYGYGRWEDEPAREAQPAE